MDGGASWSRTLEIDDRTGVVDLAADPADPNVIFAAAWQARQYPWQSYFTPVAGPGSAVYRSADGGVSWRPLGGAGWPAGPLGRISLATTRIPSGLRIYAVVSAEAAGGLYRSDDAGLSWTRVNDGKAFTSYYASRVTVSPNDPDVVWLVGQSIRRCTDGGRTCEIVKGAPGGDDYHQVWINPAHPDHMATASDQGVVVSVDAGRTWSSWYNQPTGQFYHLATDQRFPYRIYAGQQDSGTVGMLSRSNYGALSLRDWTPVGGDERDYDIPDPDDPDVVYGSGLGGRISRWDAATGQSANIAPFLEANYGERQTTTAHHFVWVTPLAVSRIGPTTLYLGGEVVFASKDRGGHWEIISPDLTGKTAGAARCDGDVAVADAKACGYGGIWTLAPSSRHAGELWVGTDDGLVQLTRDGGRHWDDVTPRGVPSWAKISSIDPAAMADGLAYVAIDNHRQGDRTPRVLATHDYGATWRDAAGDLPPDHYVAVVRCDPSRPGLLFAGTDVGVFASLDDGIHWRPLRFNLPTALVNDLLVHDDDLIAATQGRGLWVLDDIAPLRQIEASTSHQGLELLEPRPAVRVRDDNNHDTPIPPDEPAGQNPPAGAVIDYRLGEPASRVTIEIRDLSGRMVRRLTSDPLVQPDADVYFAAGWSRPPQPLAKAAGPHRVVWDLRHQRPAALDYDYSIAAVAGREAMITPAGPLAAPGRYRIDLSADGVTRTTSLELRPDPRSTATQATLLDSLSLSQTISANLATAVRGHAEMTAVHARLASLDPPAPADLLVRTETKSQDAGFDHAGALLASVETDLEGADLPPTQAQRDAVARSAAEIATAWSRWVSFRDHELAALNADLISRGQKPVVIPPPDAPAPAPRPAGEELP